MIVCFDLESKLREIIGEIAEISVFFEGHRSAVYN